MQKSILQFHLILNLLHGILEVLSHENNVWTPLVPAFATSVELGNGMPCRWRRHAKSVKELSDCRINGHVLDLLMEDHRRVLSCPRSLIS
eukprot:scaffold2224_cov261-Pinguiococcus_pyrenoidosus.AAC.6